MAKEKTQRKFNGMNYRQVQRHNSTNRRKLHQEDRKWLKVQGYKNIGWDSVIRLYQEIEEFLDKYSLEDLTIEELFLQADSIGNKYLTSQEIQTFNQRLSQEVEQISEEIEKQFPETEIEVIDFSQKTQGRVKRKRH